MRLLETIVLAVRVKVRILFDTYGGEIVFVSDNRRHPACRPVIKNGRGGNRTHRRRLYRLPTVLKTARATRPYPLPNILYTGWKIKSRRFERS